MKNEKKKNRQNRPVLIVLLLIIVVIAAGGAYYLIEHNTASKKEADLKQYFGIENDDEIAVSAGDTISETKGKRIDGTVYLDYDSVHNYINPGIYYEADSRLVIVTTPTEKVTLDLSDGGVSENREAEILDGVLYLSADYVSAWSDIAITEYAEQQYAAVKVKWTYPAASAVSETEVRTEPTIKGDILEHEESGTTLEVLDVSADGTAAEDKTEGWTKVRPESGLIGYVQDSALGDISEVTEEHESPIGEYTSAYSGERVNMAFHQTTSQAANNALSQVIASAGGINVVAPTWFFLNNNEGSMTSLASASYVETAHAAGLQVWAVMNDFDGGVNSSEATMAALSTEGSRTRIIQSVMSGIDESGADGLNVDFEKVNQESAESFLQLIRELSVECRKRGKVLSIDNYVPTYTKFMNRGEQARVADFVVTMCYDEHTSSSEEAGSVASLPFVRQGLEDTMNDDGVPKSKMIAAIPFYTRLWATSGTGTIECTAYGMADAQAAAANLNMTTSWDSVTSQNYGTVKSGDTTYQIWLEDEDSIKAKMEVIRELDLAGVAEWKLGQENSDVWGIIEEYLNS